MTEINHVLVPTDGSEDALKAAAYAGNLARAMGARVTVLLVQNDALIMPHSWGAGAGPGGMPAGTASVEEIRGMLEQRVREKDLPDTAGALGELDAEPELVIVWGHPAEEICRFATENNIDLIVMGSHGRSGIGRVLLGSVSHAVANQAPCPVTIVR
ncbi:MAG: universal stress protein [Gammaproteobacteria bacterium]|nr:universal stress protein [Gammaproteobacteria bacterium]